MECIGRWMEVFGKAVYNGRPYITYPDRKEFVLRDVADDKTAYLFKFDLGYSTGDVNVSLGFGEDVAVTLDRFDRKVTSIRWMDNDEELVFSQDGDRVEVKFTGFTYGQSYCVRVAQVTFE